MSLRLANCLLHCSALQWHSGATEMFRVPAHPPLTGGLSGHRRPIARKFRPDSAKIFFPAREHYFCQSAGSSQWAVNRMTPRFAGAQDSHPQPVCPYSLCNNDLWRTGRCGAARALQFCRRWLAGIGRSWLRLARTACRSGVGMRWRGTRRLILPRPCTMGLLRDGSLAQRSRRVRS